jgi:hypothetical protein
VSFTSFKCSYIKDFVSHYCFTFLFRWCEYPSAQVHEIGHNLNLAHSGEGTEQYGDQSGFMGYSYSQDEQKMCYNNAKNWQLGWFAGAYKEVSKKSVYTGPLKGQINYDVSGVTQTPVVVKVGNYYIGFNHRAKHHTNTAEAANQVTVQEASGSGYAQSWLVAKLSAGGQWSVDIDGMLLQVTVNSITTNADTGVAQVSIKYGACTSDADCNDTCGLEICGVLSGVCEVNPTPREYFTLLQPLFA